MRPTRPGIFALADQGVVSLGVFLTNIVLARAQPQADYGAYVVVYGVVFFLNSLFAALVAYPLSVTGAATDRAGLRGLAQGSLRLAVPATAAVAAAALGVTCWTLGRLEVAPWALAAVLLWQIQETFRRSLMAHLRHHDALAGDALSYLGQAALVGALALGGRLSPELAFGAMAVTSGAAAMLQARQLGVGGAAAGPSGHRLMREFCRLGRWLLLINVVNGLAMLAFQWTLVAAHGPREVASLEALANVVKVTHPLLLSVGNVVVPAVAFAIAREGYGGARRTALRFGVQGAVLLLPYFAVVLARPDLALTVFYGDESPYLTLGSLLQLFVVQYALIYLASVQEALLSGLKRSAAAFTAQVAGTAVGVVIGLPLAVSGGVPMVVLAGAIAHGVRVVTGYWLIRGEGAGFRAAVARPAEPASAQAGHLEQGAR